MITYEPLRAATNAITARPDRPASALLHDGPDARLVVFRIEPGQAVMPHTSASTVILSIAKGSGFVSGAAGERSVRAGDVVVYEPNERHGMRAPSHTLVVLAMIAPGPGAVP